MGDAVRSIAAIVRLSIVTLAAAGPAAAAEVDEPPPMPAFTQQQVDQGRDIYAKECALCHGIGLEGAAGPAMKGPTYELAWMKGEHTVADFFEVMQRTMPLGAPGKLSEPEALATVAYILANNGYRAGERPLDRAGLAVKLHPPGGAAAAAPRVASTAPVAERPRLPAVTGNAKLATTRVPDEETIRNIAPEDWLTYNRSYDGTRFSPLDQINRRTAAKLTPVCMAQLGEIGNFETSPIVYRGRMYVTTAHKTFALDAKTCAVHWSHTYTPRDPEHIRSNRGVALYDGKVFRGTTDGHLLAFDAENGNLLWDTHVGDSNWGYFLSAAPVAFAGRVYTGEGGGDNGIKGRIHAFDVNTGAPVWAFDVIPTGDQPGAETWAGGQDRGGGSSWSSITVDVPRRLLLVPTGNPGPDFIGTGRKGLNLYTNSVVALQADVGSLQWYVQQVPHDTRDWDTAAAPVIYEVDGRKRMAVASKDGYLYIYDRDTREIVSKVETMTHLNHDVPLSFETPIRVCPGAFGQYNGASYSPRSKMLFVGSVERCDTILLVEQEFVPGRSYFGGTMTPDPMESARGWIRGIDAATGEQRWVIQTGTPVLAATTPTAGGVVLTGTMGGEFLVLDERDGKTLYSFYTGGGIAGGISTYAVDGKQYVAVPTGSSSRGWPAPGAATIMIFALP